MPSNDEDTRPVSAKTSPDSVQTSLELHIREASGALQIIPLHRSVLQCPLGNVQVRFSYAHGEVLFRNLNPSEPIYKDGQPTASGRLEVGSFLECGSSRVLLWDQGLSRAYLKGYSHPYSGDIWPLPPGQHPVGRSGRRQNSINLEHPTVSREHATFYCEGDKYSLKAESATNPVWVAGVTASPGEIVELSPGDLIEIGELVFRFHWHGAAESNPPNHGLLRVNSLGGFHCIVAGTPIPDKDWKTQQIKWMLAHLAYQWGRPLSTETLIEELWPDFTVEKGKNNLNYSLSILRQTLRAALPEQARGQDVILRSSSTLQLNPDLLEEHDAVTLQRSLDAAARLHKDQEQRWAQLVEQAVLHYAGPFLSDCYLDWVEPIRQTLELAVLDGANRVLEYRAAREEWPAIIPVSTQALKIDPCSSWATQRLMQAFIANRAPHEALRVYENHRQALQKEGMGEPGSEVAREFTRANL